MLIVAEKYQTGFDEPLLHTMVVDKKLRDVKAVQTLSRLNRISPGKEDTFILDFVNTAEEIQEAFKPYYQETVLEAEVEVNQIYAKQKELNDFHVYGEKDVSTVCAIYNDKHGAEKTRQGRISSALKPVVDMYNSLDPKERSRFRRTIRSFVKWYRYIAQITRMYDRPLHEEYLFCSYLSKLIPEDGTAKIDLDNVLRLEFYKLERTFEGQIALEKTATVLPTPVIKPSSPKEDEKRSPLDEIIAAINDRFKGDFAEADRVIISDLYARLMKDDKLRKLAKTSEPQIFRDSQFPKIFEETAQKACMESTERYTQMFQNKEKYDFICNALAELLIREVRNNAEC